MKTKEIGQWWFLQTKDAKSFLVALKQRGGTWASISAAIQWSGAPFYGINIDNIKGEIKDIIEKIQETDTVHFDDLEWRESKETHERLQSFTIIFSNQKIPLKDIRFYTEGYNL